MWRGQGRKASVKTPCVCGCRMYDDLADGSYTFQVAALSASGDPGYPSPFTFTVDTTPPAVSQVHVQLQQSGNAARRLALSSLGDPELARQVSGSFQLQGGCLNASFMAFDGVLGSGVAR